MQSYKIYILGKEENCKRLGDELNMVFLAMEKSGFFSSGYSIDAFFQPNLFIDEDTEVYCKNCINILNDANLVIFIPSETGLSLDKRMIKVLLDRSNIPYVIM